MERIITFPVKMTETYSKKIDQAVKQTRGIESKHDFIMQAIQEKIEKAESEEN